MAIRIPTNQIITSRYTVGKEYLILSTYQEYQGYYYEINNKAFAGEKFNPNALELIKIDSDQLNILKLNPKTIEYSNISKTILLKTKELPSIFLSLLESDTKYLAKKLNVSPTKIIFISEDTYNENYQNNILYSFTKVSFDQHSGWTITDQNIKDIPEIDLFLIGLVSNENLGN
jgi:hypothetical protein